MADEHFKEVANTRKWFKVKYVPQWYEVSGVYLLVFQNKKRYVGSSKNLGQRLRSHMKAIYYQDKSWYARARQENDLFIDPWWVLAKQVHIMVCPCDDYGQFEDELLQSIEEKSMWYNTQYHSNNIKG